MIEAAAKTLAALAAALGDLLVDYPVGALAIWGILTTRGRFLQKRFGVRPSWRWFAFAGIPLAVAFHRYAAFRLFLGGCCIALGAAWLRYLASWEQRLTLGWLILAISAAWLCCTLEGRWISERSAIRHQRMSRRVMKETVKGRSGPRARVGRSSSLERTVFPVVADPRSPLPVGEADGLGATYNAIAEKYGGSRVRGVSVRRVPGRTAGEYDVSINDGFDPLRADIPFPAVTEPPCQ